MKTGNAAYLSIKKEEQNKILLPIFLIISVFFYILQNLTHELYIGLSSTYYEKVIIGSTFTETLSRVIFNNSILIVIAIIIGVMYQNRGRGNVRLNDFYMSLPIKINTRIIYRILYGVVIYTIPFMVFVLLSLVLRNDMISVENEMGLSIMYKLIVENDSIVNVLIILVSLYLFMTMWYIIAVIVQQLVNNTYIGGIATIMIYTVGSIVIRAINLLSECIGKDKIVNLENIGTGGVETVIGNIGEERISFMFFTTDFYISVISMVFIILIGIFLLIMIIRKKDGSNMSNIFYNKFIQALYRLTVPFAAIYIVDLVREGYETSTIVIYVLAVILMCTISEFVCKRIFRTTVS